MGGLPAADWPLYRMFTRWLESAVEYRAREAEELAVFSAQDDAVENYRSAHAATEAEELTNRMLRIGILQMPAASAQGVQLKAMVYRWLCNGMVEVDSKATHVATMEPGSSDAFAFAIARDFARLGAPAVLHAVAEGGDEAASAVDQDRAA